MRTKSGILSLTKAEREALTVLQRHSLQDIGYGSGGTYYKVNDSTEEEDISLDTREIKKAQLGLDVIDFILQITN
jgi:hypothetical protein